MKVYAISDLHLSTTVNKPMDIFGPSWQGHFDIIKQSWLQTVTQDDVVVLCGDLSWAMRANEVITDLALFKDLPGKKIILRGNHDYWWNTISQVRSLLPLNFYAIQNDCLRIGNVCFFGTRGWVMPENSNEQDKKIYSREIERLKLSLLALKKVRQEGDKVVCLTHFPPFNVNYELSEFIKLLIADDVHTVVYGHLHRSSCRAELRVNKFGIDFYLTSCDFANNKLIEINI
ncbi:MAG: metallophosphoesterase [Clostridia bacterium]